MVMKRRKRTRSSKVANPPTPKIPVDGEKSAGPSIVLDEADRRTPPRDELIAAVETEKSVEPSAALAGADRRTHPRYEFTAAVEVVAPESGARIETRVRDLSQQGAYVDTNNPLPLGTVTDVRITKGAQLFEALARVVYSRVGKGMGLVFTAIKPQQLRTLETWLAESRETSWLAANRRRSQRVLMTIQFEFPGGTFSDRLLKKRLRHWRSVLTVHRFSCRRRCTEDSGSLCRTSRQKLRWSVLSHTMTGIKPIVLRWEWSSFCPIQYSGTWPFRQKTGRPVTQMKISRQKRANRAEIPHAPPARKA